MSLTSPTLFLLLLLIIGLIGKNQSILVAVLFLLVVKWTGLGTKIFPYLEDQGIQVGITFITIAILVPIATGKVNLNDLLETVKSIYGMIALLSGLAVAMLGAYGVKLLSDDPQVTIALVLGTILAVTFFKGVAVGPLIGAGMAYMIMKAIHLFH